MKQCTLFLCFLLLAGISSIAQDKAFAVKMVDTLCSKNFWGRGYTKNGMHKAAIFLKDELKKYGITPMQGNSFFQEYVYIVNSFPGKMDLSIDGMVLQAGKDFIPAAESKGAKNCGTLKAIDSAEFVDVSNKVIVKLKDKLTMDVAQQVAEYTLIEIDKKSLKNIPNKYAVNIENKLIRKFTAQNICGIIKGTTQPDSIIMITAHYDHLGGLGASHYFPGANDNASGVSLLLNLARYYALHPQAYSIGFILFSGEEAGLLGSKYFTENPLVDLSKIKFLINTDLAGTGIEGITVVNATEFKNEFLLMQKINEEYQYFKTINSRGKAANSDHYWFTEKGVPSFFIYTLGGIKAYHDVFDKAETLPLNKHEDLFNLIVAFNKKLQGL